MHCPAIVSIQAEWNNIGSSPSGLMALLNLVRNMRFLEMLDLKNNKITHQSADILA
jgi:Ran GTPase-activating protein (RanGAP) involved in mRNA processing and transport